MKTTKILITSLLAAATLSVPAFAAKDVTVSGSATADGAGTFTITSTETDDSFSATASPDSSTGLYTYKTSVINNRHISIGAVSIDADTTLNIYTTGPSDVKFTSATQLTGSGTLILNRDQEGTQVSSIYKIESGANLSNFTGTIKVLNKAADKKNAALWLDGSAANATISLSTGAGLVVSGTNVSVAGLVGDATSSLRSQNTVDYNGDGFSGYAPAYAGDNNGTVARTLTIGGSGTYDFAGSVGSATNQTSLNLTKSGTGTQTFSGTSYFGDVAVSGGELIFSGTSATSKGTASVAGALTTSDSGVVKVLENGVLDLSGATVSLANAIQNSGQVTISENTVFDITEPGSAVTLISGTGTLSGTAWNTLARSNFTYNGAQLNGRSTLDLSTSGTATLSYVEAKTLTWNGSASDTWSEAVVGTEPSSKPWKDESDADDAFYAGDSVVFSKDETTTVTVADSGVNANTVTISAGTVSFTGGTITATGGVSVTGGTLSVLNSTTLGTNKLTLSGGTLQAGANNLSLANAVDVSAASGIDTNGNNLTLTGQLTGSGTLTKTGTGTLYVSGRTDNAFTGTLHIQGGTVWMGGSNTRGDSSLTNTPHGAKILVERDATILLNMGGASSAIDFNGDFYLKDGSTIKNRGGLPKLVGDIVFGATDTAGAFSATANVVFAQEWGKTIDLAGKIFGAGMVELQNASGDNITAIYKISGAENSFSGTYKLTGALVGDKERLVKLQLTTQTAAKNASVNLTTQYASLELGTSAVDIAGLAGAAGSSVGLVSGTAASTLTVNQASDTTFAGTIADGIALVKSGAGTLTLNGDNAYTGGTVIEEGTVVAANANALGTTKGVEVKSGAALNLGASAVTVAGLSGAGTVGLASGTTSSTLTVDSATDSTFSGSVSGAIALVKQGAGTLELSGNNTMFVYPAIDGFNPGVDVRAGTVRIVQTGSNVQSFTNVSVADGATLELSTVSDVIAVNATSVVLSSTAKILVDMSNYASDADIVAVNLISASALSYGSDTITSDNVDLLLGAIELKNWGDGWAQSLSYTDNTLQLTLTIPEPSAFGLLAGLGALALAGTRRRRKKA